MKKLREMPMKKKTIRNNELEENEDEKRGKQILTPTATMGRTKLPPVIYKKKLIWSFIILSHPISNSLNLEDEEAEKNANTTQNCSEDEGNHERERMEQAMAVDRNNREDEERRL